MTPAQFVVKWNANTQTERAASQSHFLDLCALLQHDTPNDDPHGENFAFEKGATKSGGGQGYADVWKRDHFAWEYKGKHKDLQAAMSQVAQYSGALYNPPLLVACDMQKLVVRANFPGFPTQTHEVDLKHRVFQWIESAFLPSDAVVAFARDDDYFFGVLHSRAHEVWARAQGTQLRERESGFRYTPTSCFETFPFPKPDEAACERISLAAKNLDTLRSRWLNPPEWMREEVLEFPARADGIWSRFVAPDSVSEQGIGTAQYARLVPKDGEMTVYDARPNANGVLETRAMKLKDALPRRTLTNLYNERPAWLDNAHRALDEAVFAAYGWTESDLSDEEILSRLLELNQA